ncbi:hypothetical protein [Sphingomicrobium arenosum]|uniref:hypothetical protein n=1 Tax=Sphingomicrobium arenosum TaxID=2233861 RepID=UPI002241003D|nr:hypothetical protein [Sphingomicrobium arenosum]
MTFAAMIAAASIAAPAIAAPDVDLTAAQAETMDSSALADLILGQDHGPISGHRIAFRSDGRISSIRLAEEGAADSDGRCVRRSYIASFDGSDRSSDAVRLHRVRAELSFRPGDSCEGSDGWVLVDSPADLENARRVLAEIEEIRARQTGAPEAGLYCRDDTLQGKCGEDVHATLKSIDLDDAWKLEPYGGRNGAFYQLSVNDTGIDDAVPRPQWVLRYMPSPSPAAPVLTMQYYQPVPGPPSLPGEPNAVVVGEL